MNLAERKQYLELVKNTALKVIKPKFSKPFKFDMTYNEHWPSFRISIDIPTEDFYSDSLYFEVQKNTNWNDNSERTGWLKIESKGLFSHGLRDWNRFKIKDLHYTDEMNERVQEFANKWVERVLFDYELYKEGQKASEENKSKNKDVVNFIKSINKKRYDVSYDDSVYRIEGRAMSNDTYVTIDLDINKISIELNEENLTAKKLKALKTLLEK